ncbi:succinate dehydrogenase [Azospirillum sp. RWY-5-1]|uniref:Succinate dehydrogenase n=1 Tax=Azospirillum oleiclasticum TaxID=2735135 RepID=A0ABX2TAP4_9PROT|nr:succinate dehydrogenase [Azospirillum oleiclasticum]NYZ13239.1 succinate dehydrogenase [Azospirillum oleiclasticum]NYZ20089.1 succinate dehydrogenase [Azospirillum oleiclasticum]
MSTLSRVAASRNHPAYWAFLVHRLSGLGLALFLPLHLLVLGLAVERASLDGFLSWTDRPLVKLAETGLVVLLAVHLTGGLRVLALEFLPWSDAQKTRIAIAFGVALAVGLLFLLLAV